MATARLREAPTTLVGNAARLLVARWPEFLVLALLGVALREAATWAAVEVSAWNAFVGQLLLVLAPLGYLLPVIAMLYRCGPDLPGVSAALHADAPDAPTEGRDRRLVDVAVSVLLPFVTVYAALGLHDQDFARFANAAAFDEFRTKLDNADYLQRLGYNTLPVVILIIIGSWIVRWMLGLTERRTGLYALAFVGALVEVYYTGQLVAQVTSMWHRFSTWFHSREVVIAIADGYHRLVDPLGPLARPVDAVVDAVGWLFSEAELLVLVPAAWLVVAAIVLGHKLIPPPVPEHRLLEKLSPAAKEIGETLFDDAMDRASVFGQGILLVLRSGFVNVTVFAAIFLAASRIPFWFSALVRHLTGPMDEWDWLTISLFTDAVGLALSMVVIAPLLAAAVEWLVVPVMAGAGPRSAPRPGHTSATAP